MESPCSSSAVAKMRPARHFSASFTRSQADSRGQAGGRATQVIAALSRPILFTSLLLLGLHLLARSVEAQQEVSSAPANPDANVNNQNASVVATQTATNKLKPVNFTLVDELFEAALDDDELSKRWHNMDAQFQEGIRSILKLVFPQIVAVSQDAKVSGDCSGGILKWILSLRNLRSWAIKMLDATGKPTSGIFEGSLTMFGNHRQCLSIRAPDEDEIEITDQFEEYFRGQFCVLHMRPWMGAKQPFYNLNSSVTSLLRTNYKYYEKTLYDELAEIAIAFNFIHIRMDLCVPSTCSIADIQRVADLLSRKLEMRAKVMRCDIESRDPASTLMQNMDAITLYWAILPLSLLALTLFSSLLVAFSKRQMAHHQHQSQPKMSRLVRCLSLQGAATGLFRTNNQTCAFSKPLPLYGLRNVFIIWFIIVQLTVELNYQYLRESLVLRNMLLTYWPFQIIINTSMIFESLILITAFTFSYSNLESNAGQVGRYLINKYVRLVPTIVTLVMLTIITPTIGLTSPVWKNFVERQAQVCKSTGYLNLFFLQNFISYDKICLPHTWLLCVEFQLIVLTVPLVLLLKKTLINNEDSIIIDRQTNGDKHLKAVGGEMSSDHFISTLKHLVCHSRAGLMGALLVILGVVINFTLVYTNQLPPAWFHTFPDAQQKSLYFSRYLAKAWTHLGAFVVGLYAGYLCRATIQLQMMNCHQEAANSQASKRASNVQGWQQVMWKLGALGCLLAIIFSTFSWSTGSLPTPLVSALYDSLARLIWSLALSSLMIHLCLPKPTSEQAADVNFQFSSWWARLLSHPVCLVLGRLSLLAYLLTPYVHTIILALQEQSLFPSLYLIFHVILGNIVITYSLALVISLLIERPLQLAVRDLLFPTTAAATDATAAAATATPAAYQRPGCLHVSTSSLSASNTNTTTSATSLAG